MISKAKGRHTAAIPLLVTLSLIGALLAVPQPASSATTPLSDSSNRFIDDDGDTFENAISAVADRGITLGCNPPENDRFCPHDTVTRGQMAAFITRVMGLEGSSPSTHADARGHTFEKSISAIAAAGITKGCNPPKNDMFCPDAPVTRGQMAAFIARAKNLAPGSGSDFIDSKGHTFESSIRAIASAGITHGCNPPNNDKFCPDTRVTRGQMAAFLVRAWDIPSPAVNIERSGPIVVSGTHGRVIEGLHISNPSGTCLRIEGSSNVVVRNSVLGPCGGRAVEIVNSSKVTLDSLQIVDVESGVLALESQTVAVEKTTFKNAGRNFVQFDKVTGPGNIVDGNRGSNQLGGSSAEDFVSIYKSGGTSSSPLRVTDNHLSNGGPSASGSGIMVGDKGGSHIVVQSNVLSDTGQTGIGVAGGDHIKVIDNKVTSSSHPWSNVGIYVWDQGSVGCSEIEVRGNVVAWRNADGTYNASWNGGNCGPIDGWESNDFR